MDKFVHLHLHNTYSFTDGYGLPEQYMQRTKEIGQIAIATTNHGNISDHYKWYKTANKYGIKPILGCELYITPKNGDTINNKKYHHITVLALNNIGYKNLLKIVTESWKSNTKKPLIDMDFVIQNQKGLLITSGCPSGRVIQLLITGQTEKAEQELLYYKNNIEHFYIEISPWKYPPVDKVIEQLYNLSKKLKIPMVATMDCHYIKQEQFELQEILLCIQSNDLMSNPDRWKFDQNDFYLKSREEMELSFKQIVPNLDLTEALDNTVKISEMVDFKFPKASPLKFPISDEEKRFKLYEMCKEGMVQRNLVANQIYEERMKYEYDLIVQKDFIDYFLIVADLVQWTKNNKILVGPARGSAAGSLICYLLRITEVDPIKHDLMFERFIDINREDLPDIDIDFEDDKRSYVISYLNKKYGDDKVSNIATFSTFKGKNIIYDFGRIFRMPFDIINKLKSIIIERSGGDSRASLTVQDSFEQFDTAKEYIKQYPFLKFAPIMESQIRNMSSHASGVIINNEPITDFCAIYQTNGEPITSMDYYDASELGLTKIDILGLNTLTCIKKALNLIKERKGIEIDIYNISLDDKRIYKEFQNPKKLFGIFQFDGTSVNQVCRQMKPENFEELVAINALARPGPMHGMDLELEQPITSVYIARKWGHIPKKFAHPLLKPITDGTQGVIIYQEQVMKVMKEIGNMSWKDTAEIRKNISKSRGIEAFNEYKAKFAIGAKENGLTNFEIDNIWSAVCSHGCLSGDAKIKIKKGKTIKLKDLYTKWEKSEKNRRGAKQFFKFNGALSFNNGDGLINNKILKVVKTGMKETYLIKTNRKKSIKATEDHRFLTPIGWKKLNELAPGDLVAVQIFPNKGKDLKKRFLMNPELKIKPQHTKNFYKSLNLRNNSSTNSAKFSQEKIRDKNKKWWDKHPEVKIGLIDRIPEDKLNTYGKICRASDGHICHSLNELKLEEWLIKNKLEHTPHPIIQYNKKTNRPRKADQLVKGQYLEMDGIGRTEAFWKEKYIDLIDRLVIITSNENLDSKLKFLKNNQLSYIGSLKKKNNHREIKWKMIQSIEYFGKEETYDICMEAPYNSYIANDFIVHNSWSFNKSHSVSYSMISYWCMFLKVYHPIEYYAAMVSTMHNEDKIRRIIKEYIREGYELLPIDINRSGETFLIDDDKLRLGFSQIKGIGQSVAEKIFSNRTYSNIEDFEKRSKAGKKSTELLSKMGAFNSIGGTSIKTNTLFGVVKNKKYDDSVTLEEKIKICPFSVDFNIFEQWSNFINQHIKFPVDTIEQVNSDKNSQTIIGIVYDKNLKDKIEEALTRGKPAPQIENGLSKFCNFILEDDTDFVTIRVSPKNFPAFKSLIFEQITEGDIVMIKGRMGDGIRMFFANEILCLNHLRRKLENNEQLTESEMVLTGKMWRNIPKRNNGYTI